MDRDAADVRGVAWRPQIGAPRFARTRASRLAPVLVTMVGTWCFTAAPAQTQEPNSRTLRGVVREAVTGETVPHATVSVPDHGLSTLTNFDGRFTLLGVPLDSVVVRVEALGHALFEVSVGPSAEPGAVDLDVRLAVQAITMEGILANVGGNAEVVRDLSQVTISPRQVETLPSLGEVDVFRALQLMPGVTSAGDGSGMYVRGGTPDQNLVLFDGMTMYHVDHLFGLFSAFNADAIKDVNLYTGGFPARYGGRVSSVVELTGKTGDEERFRLGAGANLLSVRGVAEIPLGGKGSWLIAGRRSYTDLVNTTLYEHLFDYRTGFDETPTGGFGGGGQIFQLRPEFYFYDLNSKLSYRPTPDDLVSISLYGGTDRLDQSVDATGPGGGTAVGQRAARDHVTDWGNRGASGRWFRAWSPRLSSDLLLATSTYYSDDRNVSEGAGRREENVIDDASVRLDFHFHASPALTLRWGTWWTESSVEYEFARLTEDTASFSIDPSASGRFTGGYGDASVTVRNDLDLSAGLRTTRYDLTGKTYWEPRASATWSTTDALSVRAAWGRFNQFVTRVENEDVLEGSRDFWLLADGDLLPVASEHRIVGLGYERAGALFNVEAYHKTFENLTLFSTRFRASPTVEPGDLFLTGRGEARGVEFLAQKLGGTLTGWVTYALTRVTQRFADIDRGAEFPAGHDQRHTVKVVTAYKMGDWELSGSWTYGSGRPYTAPDDQYFLTMLDGEVYSYVGVGAKNSLRFPSYHRLDVAAFRRFDLRWFDVELGLSAFNAYNRNNLWYRQFDLTTQPVTITDIAMLGFTPSIDLRFTLK